MLALWRPPIEFGGVFMVILQVVPPETILIDTFAVVKVCLAFMTLAGVVWVSRKLIKTVNRS